MAGLKERFAGRRHVQAVERDVSKPVEGRIYSVQFPDELEKAGLNDLVQLIPTPGNRPMVIKKKTIQMVAAAIISKLFLHLHGDTGTGKSALLEALILVQENWSAACALVGAPYKPLEVYTIEMVNYETPGELYKRRSIMSGNTYDEESEIVRAVRDLTARAETCYGLIWLREIGRVQSAAVQGGLLNLINPGMIRLPDGTHISGAHVAWAADSNYSANENAVHTLVTQDDALARRWMVSLLFEYMSSEDEVRILRYLRAIGQLPEVDDVLILKVVDLGQKIRTSRSQGRLLSLAPPSLYGYFAFLQLADILPHLSIQDVAEATLLGAASPADREEVRGVFAEVFGLKVGNQDDGEEGGITF